VVRAARRRTRVIAVERVIAVQRLG
jgi:hypothetical protein